MRLFLSPPVIALAISVQAFSQTGDSAEHTLQTVTKEPPTAVAESIRTMVSSSMVQLSANTKPTHEFWFVKELAKRADHTGAPLAAVPEATLLGVVNVLQRQQDYKDNEIEPGVYTLRFVLQPQDGDHLGTALFPYFAVLIPAKRDASPGAFTSYKPMVKASGQDTSTGHPIVLSLRPATTAAGAPKIVEPEPDHHAIRMQIPAKTAGRDGPSPLPFDLVFRGHGKTQ